MVTDDTDAAEPTPGLLASLRRLLRTFAEILHTRVDILSTELEEGFCRAQQVLVYGLAPIFFIGLGLVLATLFVVMAYWETNRLYVLGCFAVSYLGIGVIAALVVRQKLRTRPRLFSTTLTELRKDHDSLGARL